MQSVVGRAEERRRSSAASASAASLKEGSAAISMYTEPPSEDISLEDFESYAMDRLAGATMFLASLSPLRRVITVFEECTASTLHF